MSTSFTCRERLLIHCHIVKETNLIYILSNNIFPFVLIYIVLVMKQIHVTMRLTTFVSTCRPRARTAVHNSREGVIGAAT